VTRTNGLENSLFLQAKEPSEGHQREKEPSPQEKCSSSEKHSSAVSSASIQSGEAWQMCAGTKRGLLAGFESLKD